MIDEKEIARLRKMLACEKGGPAIEVLSFSALLDEVERLRAQVRDITSTYKPIQAQGLRALANDKMRELAARAEKAERERDEARAAGAAAGERVIALSSLLDATERERDECSRHNQAQAAIVLRLDRCRSASAAAMHAQAPAGGACADCTMDKVACWPCYRAWYRKTHPHVHFVPDDATSSGCPPEVAKQMAEALRGMHLSTQWVREDVITKARAALAAYDAAVKP